MILLLIAIRLFNKYIMKATQTERIFSERKAKSEYVYEYRSL